MELSLAKKGGNNADSGRLDLSKVAQRQQYDLMSAAKQQLAEVVRVLRTLEDRYNNLMRKVQLTDQNMLSEHKRLNNELKLVDADLIDSKKELNELSYKFGLIIKELELTAKKQDVDLIKRYIELWQPMEFIRKKDAEKLVEDLLREKVKKKETVL